MSIESTLEQVSAIRQVLLDPAILIGGPSSAQTGGTEAPATGEASTSNDESSFAAALARASGVAGVSPASSAEGPGELLSGIAQLNENSLPEQLAGWKRERFYTETRDTGSAYGEHSKFWVFKNGQRSAVVALDYP